VNLVAAAIFPLIFIFPYIKAYYGLSVPAANATMSSSKMIKVASAVPTFPLWIAPVPFLRSIVHEVTSPPLDLATSKKKTAFTFLTRSAP